jgi:hypothetical protein
MGKCMGREIKGLKLEIWGCGMKNKIKGKIGMK